MKLGKKQLRIIILIGISTILFYYMNNLIKIGGNFSDGILAGFLMGLIFICALVILYTWGEMLYLNFKADRKK